MQLTDAEIFKAVVDFDRPWLARRRQIVNDKIEATRADLMRARLQAGRATDCHFEDRQFVLAVNTPWYFENRLGRLLGALADIEEALQ